MTTKQQKSRTIVPPKLYETYKPTKTEYTKTTRTITTSKSPVNVPSQTRNKPTTQAQITKTKTEITRVNDRRTNQNQTQIKTQTQTKTQTQIKTQAQNVSKYQQPKIDINKYKRLSINPTVSGIITPMPYMGIRTVFYLTRSFILHVLLSYTFTRQPVIYSWLLSSIPGPPCPSR
jgi:hypothetical protein